MEKWLILVAIFAGSCTTRPQNNLMLSLPEAELEEVPPDFKLNNFQTLIINMENDGKSARRWERIEGNFSKFNLEFERFPAVNGYAFKGHYDQTSSKRQILNAQENFIYQYDPHVLKRGLKAGELGNYFSHYKAALSKRRPICCLMCFSRNR